MRKYFYSLELPCASVLISIRKGVCVLAVQSTYFQNSELCGLTGQNLCWFLFLFRVGADLGTVMASDTRMSVPVVRNQTLQIDRCRMDLFSTHPQHPPTRTFAGADCLRRFLIQVPPSRHLA